MSLSRTGERAEQNRDGVVSATLKEAGLAGLVLFTTLSSITVSRESAHGASSGNSRKQVYWTTRVRGARVNRLAHS